MVDWQNFSPDSMKQIRETLGPPREARTRVYTDPNRPSTHGIQQIGLWDSSCGLGGGSELSALLQVDSGEIWLAQREGGGYSNDRWQRYQGNIFPVDAAQLCEFLVQMDFFSLADEYEPTRRIMDASFSSLMIACQENQVKFAATSGPSPTVLWASIVFFRHLMSDAEWVEFHSEERIAISWEQISLRVFTKNS
jgi:hypothetical protein